jgi:hypothetical protein
MILYTCSLEKFAGSPPPPLAHPCGRAAKALDDAGHRYEIKRVKAGRLRPWTWLSYARDRAGGRATQRPAGRPDPRPG